jgi:hypothetical protein
VSEIRGRVGTDCTSDDDYFDAVVAFRRDGCSTPAPADAAETVLFIVVAPMAVNISNTRFRGDAKTPNGVLGNRTLFVL